MEYIANDLPAAVNYVKNYTNARKVLAPHAPTWCCRQMTARGLRLTDERHPWQVHYVGHSMGGIILYRCEPGRARALQAPLARWTRHIPGCSRIRNSRSVVGR
jgi:hypothetical protein